MENKEVNKSISTSLVCKCGKIGWISLGEKSDIYPNCRRIYEFSCVEGLCKVRECKERD